MATSSMPSSSAPAPAAAPCSGGWPAPGSRWWRSKPASTGIRTRDFATDEKAQEKLFWTDERLSAGADPLAFGSNNSGIGVGGSTLHFTAYTPRPQPDDLCLASETGVGVDWPFGHRRSWSLISTRLRRSSASAARASYPWGPPRKNGYALPPLPLNAAALAMQRGCAATGIATSPAANAALSQVVVVAGPGATARLHAARLLPGRLQRQAPRAASTVVFIPPALAHGAELRTESFATRIERDAQGRISGIIYVQGGVETRQRCRNVFLCAGAVETPRLLLMNERPGPTAPARSAATSWRTAACSSGASSTSRCRPGAASPAA